MIIRELARKSRCLSLPYLQGITNSHVDSNNLAPGKSVRFLGKPFHEVPLDSPAVGYIVPSYPIRSV